MHGKIYHMQYFDLDDGTHTYRIHCRPPRKTNRRLRLTVDGRGCVHLSRSPRTPLCRAQQYARDNLAWIAARATPLAAQSPAPYGRGSSHWLLGQSYSLQWTGDHKTISIDGRTLRTAPGDEADIRRRFNILHRDLSERYLPAMVEAQLPHCPWVNSLPPIRYRAMRNTFGSCRRDGVLTFNTRLIQYPVELIEHVIVHELCHLAVFDHSAAFYALMQQAQSDYRIRRRDLHAFARLLPA